MLNGKKVKAASNARQGNSIYRKNDVVLKKFLS